MKVLDLQCAAQHLFEGWFGSEEDFQNQLQGQQLQCPVCGSADIRKRLSAPRLNLGARKPQAAQPPAHHPQEGADPEALRRAQAAWLRWSRKVAAEAEDVGDRFAEEARSIHQGESAERLIRGQASPAQAVALLEEGIPVLPLWTPASANKTLQ